MRRHGGAPASRAGWTPALLGASDKLVKERPREFLVPDLFVCECMAVLCRMRGANRERVIEALDLLASLGISRVPMGAELMDLAASRALEWKLSGYDAIYVALASLSGAVWLTADRRAARKVKDSRLVRVLGE